MRQRRKQFYPRMDFFQFIIQFANKIKSLIDIRFHRNCSIYDKGKACPEIGFRIFINVLPVFPSLPRPGLIEGYFNQSWAILAIKLIVD